MLVQASSLLVVLSLPAFACFPFGPYVLFSDILLSVSSSCAPGGPCGDSVILAVDSPEVITFGT